MRAPRRALVTLALGGALGACGGSEPASYATVRECLEQRGLRVLGAERPAPDDHDAPDRGELITRGAFIAFYSSSERADELAGEVRESAAQGGAEVERYGAVTVVYLRDADRTPIEDCLES